MPPLLPGLPPPKEARNAERAARSCRAQGLADFSKISDAKVTEKCNYPLVMTNIAIENGHL